MTQHSSTFEASQIRKYATASRRLGYSVVAGLIAANLVLLSGHWRLVPLAGWDVAVLTYVVWVWGTVWPMNARQTREHAVREDPSRATSDAVLIVASLVSLVAVGVLMVQSVGLSGTEKDLLIGLGVFSVVLSWALVHTIHALKYARLYYSDPEGGIDFNGDKPVYADFAYLSFTLGMTFQVSDTALKTRRLRVAVLQHTLLSYVFGTVIIAATINLLAGLTK